MEAKLFYELITYYKNQKEKLISSVNKEVGYLFINL